MKPNINIKNDMVRSTVPQITAQIAFSFFFSADRQTEVPPNLKHEESEKLQP